jgi:MSHA biogenesis protein MshO
MNALQNRTVRQAGFTLIEAIMSIVLIGIIGGIVAVFIRAPIQSYKDSVERAELTDLADLSLRRMARDIRLALPNSIRIINGRTIEFLLTKSGGRYLSASDIAVPANFVLSFDTATLRKFTAIGPLDADPRRKPAVGDYVVVNNQSVDTAPVNAYLANAGGTNRNIAMIEKIEYTAGPNLPWITLVDNPFAQQVPSMPSETSRFQVVSGPVTYHCASLGAGGNGMLHRQWNYPIAETQIAPPVDPVRPASLTVPQSHPLIERVQDCQFTYEAGTNGRSGMVILALTLKMPDSGDIIKLVHQVHVDNTP